MKCLYCQLHDVYPEAVAGLCVSCAWGVRRGSYLVATDGAGRLVVRLPRATPDNPLGHEGDEQAREYLPPEVDAAEYRAQLVSLAYEAHGISTARPWTVARRVVAEIRGAGCEIRIDSQYGRAVLSHPRRVPYPVLVRFVENQTEVEDELTREEAARLKSERAENVQVEQSGGSTRANFDASEGTRIGPEVQDASAEQGLRATVPTL